ncbi:MAG: DUF5110 domain-containing protein, partial [Anaerolineae bacterium]
GLRRDGSTRDELIVQVVPAPEASTFTLYEDDGRSTAYQSGSVRSTALSQQETEATINVAIGAAEGTYEGAATARNNVIQVALNGQRVDNVLLDGESLPVLATQAAFEAAERGWYQGKTAVYAKSGVQPVEAAKEFTVQLAEQPVTETVMERTAVPAAPPVETPHDSNLPGSLVWGILIIVLVLLAGTIFWWRRKNAGPR